MATQSAVPPNPTEVKPQTPDSEVVQPPVENHEDAKDDKEISAPSVFVNTEPIREDQVQNAVKFLSHPKVKGSPVIYRRSFLERKGLTKEEIDEAFRRVPDPPSSVSTAQQAITNQDGQLNSSSSIQSQGQSQALQPAAAAPAGAISKVGTLVRSQFHWSHALLAVGLLAVTGAGTAIIFKNAMVPRLKAWIRKVVLEEEEEELVKKTKSKPSFAEEAAAAAAAAQAAASAATDVARTSQEMLLSKTEEKKYFRELLNLLDMQVKEMKSMSNTIKKLEGQSYIPRQGDYKVSGTSSKPLYSNGKADLDSRSARSMSPPASVEPSNAPHPKSYMEIMDMVQRGERPPNIREINDLPPNPNQPVSNPRLAPRPKPWEVAQAQNTPSYMPQFQDGIDGLNSNVQDNGFVNQLNGDGSAPWWQQKNVRITEIETEDENKTGSSVEQINERPIQRSWVPPQPPPVVMAEAAAAIRQPKKPASQKEQSTDDKLLARSSEITDELQMITKISESGGVMEANGGSSSVNTEIQQEDNNNYYEA